MFRQVVYVALAKKIQEVEGEGETRTNLKDLTCFCIFVCLKINWPKNKM